MAYTIKTKTDGTIFTNGLGAVRGESVSKDAQLFQMPMPTQDSPYAIILALFGTLRTINLSGTFTSTDGAISTFISELDGLTSGLQSTRKYHSDTSGQDYFVFISKTDWKRAEGEVNKIDWSIDMIEGANIV
jgi:hypothetical protein